MGLAKAGVWQAPLVLTFNAGPNAALLTLPDVTMFIADTDYELVSVSEVHEVLGTDGSAVTLDIKKCTGVQAAASGLSMLLTTFNLKATVQTVVTKNIANAGLAVLQSSRRVVAGERIALDFGGTMTAFAGCCIVLTLKRLRRPAY